jgi:hypothetical protein
MSCDGWCLSLFGPLHPKRSNRKNILSGPVFLRHAVKLGSHTLVWRAHDIRAPPTYLLFMVPVSWCLCVSVLSFWSRKMSCLACVVEQALSVTRCTRFSALHYPTSCPSMCYPLLRLTSARHVPPSVPHFRPGRRQARWSRAR